MPSNLRSQSPPNAVVLNNLGAALMSLGEHEEGVARLEQASAMDPENVEALVNLAVHWQEEGNLTRAREYYARYA